MKNKLLERMQELAGVKPTLNEGMVFKKTPSLEEWEEDRGYILDNFTDKDNIVNGVKMPWYREPIPQDYLSVVEWLINVFRISSKINKSFSSMKPILPKGLKPTDENYEKVRISASNARLHARTVLETFDENGWKVLDWKGKKSIGRRIKDVIGIPPESAMEPKHQPVKSYHWDKPI